MKITVTADIHIGNHRQHGGELVAGINDRCRLVLKALSESIRIARGFNTDCYIVAGDLCDTDNPSPQLIKQIQDRLTGKQIDEADMFTSLLLGNHDMTSTAEWDNALGPFQDQADIYEKPALVPYVDGELVYVPFQPGPADEWLEEQMDLLLTGVPPKKRRVLILHLGIKDENTPPFLVNSHDAIHVDDLAALCFKHGIRRVFTGNWHDHQNWERKHGDKVVDIHQIGTLCPTGWDNPGFDGYGKVVAYNTANDKITFVEIPGPRFIKALAVDGPSSKEWKKTRSALYQSAKIGNSNFLKIKTSPEYFKYFVAELEILKNSKALVDGKVLVEDNEIKVAAAQAAIAAKGSNVVETSIERYLDKMYVEDGVDKAAVLQRLKSYMKG